MSAHTDLKFSIMHKATVVVWLHFDTKSNIKSSQLLHFISQYVKCVEKEPFCKSGHIYFGTHVFANCSKTTKYCNILELLFRTGNRL